jgi:hypothetical protein
VAATMTDTALMAGYINDLQKFTFSKWASLSPGKRLSSALGCIATVMRSCQVPLPTPNTKTAPTDLGSFLSPSWEVSIGLAAYQKGAPTPLEMAELAKTIYHEFRHCEQHFAIARYVMLEKLSIKRGGELSQNKGLPLSSQQEQGVLTDAADAAFVSLDGLIPRATLRAAAKQPLDAKDPLFPLAQEWLAQKPEHGNHDATAFQYQLNIEAIRLASHSRPHTPSPKFVQSMTGGTPVMSNAVPPSTSKSLPAPKGPLVSTLATLFEKEQTATPSAEIRAAKINGVMVELKEMVTTSWSRRYDNYRNGIPTERDAHALEDKLGLMISQTPFAIGASTAVKNS